MEMGVLKRGKALRLLQTAILLPGDICEAIPSNSEFAAREQLTIMPNRIVQPSQQLWLASGGWGCAPREPAPPVPVSSPNPFEFRAAAPTSCNVLARSAAPAQAGNQYNVGEAHSPEERDIGSSTLPWATGIFMRIYA